MISQTWEKMKKSSRYMIVTGIVFLIISLPTFLDYNMFPTINSNIGPHQLSSWISFFFSFVGFVLLVVGFGEEDI
ncbi:hypothetical protein ACLIKE_07825 [Ferroplasma acidiphilum]|jgi:hypothetical protein|uniref:Uncharacterized protein n=2 Tax=Ferroplasma TaxID=74968 RepID=S0AQZ0_FERAC|nr:MULTISPECIES: hypothetical protein [Ferroplasma]MCL4348632.1 hypothetical protein [Candidatus Thermoplasmatota archaeon]AGO61351.1 hypothetical protein FACI_IFERC00001G1371 [Ferroplasma acidarmanus Fer1]ARD84303.1 hypothetical protein FAD_0382 [Ferroplasma acidiphilum]NOL59342.1 hypothetical protein [Ferroplasma acidiphilum]WMT53208.1 MAG: hypothetical protein RE473_09400 [Ferroplasma acidiphilum]